VSLRGRTNPAVRHGRHTIDVKNERPSDSKCNNTRLAQVSDKHLILSRVDDGRSGVRVHPGVARRGRAREASVPENEVAFGHQARVVRMHALERPIEHVESAEGLTG